MEKQIETTIDLGCRVERLGVQGLRVFDFGLRGSGFGVWGLSVCGCSSCKT